MLCVQPTPGPRPDLVQRYAANKSITLSSSDVQQSLVRIDAASPNEAAWIACSFGMLLSVHRLQNQLRQLAEAA